MQPLRHMRRTSGPASPTEPPGAQWSCHGEFGSLFYRDFCVREHTLQSMDMFLTHGFSVIWASDTLNNLDGWVHTLDGMEVWVLRTVNVTETCADCRAHLDNSSGMAASSGFPVQDNIACETLHHSWLLTVFKNTCTSVQIANSMCFRCRCKSPVSFSKSCSAAADNICSPCAWCLLVRHGRKNVAFVSFLSRCSCVWCLLVLRVT